MAGCDAGALFVAAFGELAMTSIATPMARAAMRNARFIVCSFRFDNDATRRRISWMFREGDRCAFVTVCLVWRRLTACVPLTGWKTAQHPKESPLEAAAGTA